MAYEQPSPSFYPPSPAPRPRRRLLPLLAAATALVVLGVGTWFGYTRFVKEDPGVAACKAFAAGDKTFDGKQANDKQMTEAEYRQLRGVFEASRHEDIRDHGTKLIDLAWQMSQLGEDPGMGALAYIGPLTQHMTGLQSACADQGVIVSFPNAQASAKPAGPKCSDVFTDGKTIPADFDGSCVKPDGDVWTVFVMECASGKKLYTPDEFMGVKKGWGYGGGKYHAEDTTAFNSRYNKEMLKC